MEKYIRYSKGKTVAKIRMLGEKLGRKDDYLKQVLKQGSCREKETE